MERSSGRKPRRPLWMTPLGDETFNDAFFDRLATEWEGFETRQWTPAFNLSEKEGVYLLIAELPGVDRAQISVSIKNNYVSVSGTKQLIQEEESAQYHIKEIRAGTFSRSIRLPRLVDEEKAQAIYKDGVLKLIMPLKLEPRERKIKVHT